MPTWGSPPSVEHGAGVTVRENRKQMCTRPASQGQPRVQRAGPRRLLYRNRWHRAGPHEDGTTYTHVHADVSCYNHAYSTLCVVSVQL